MCFWNLCCNGNIFKYAKITSLLELCAGVIICFGLAIPIFIYYNVLHVLLLALFNFSSVLVNIILLALDFWKIRQLLIYKWNFVLRIIWTMLQVAAIILYLYYGFEQNFSKDWRTTLDFDDHLEAFINWDFLLGHMPTYLLSIGERSQTTLTRFCPLLTAYLSPFPISSTTSSCQRSLWTPPYLINKQVKQKISFSFVQLHFL